MCRECADLCRSDRRVQANVRASYLKVLAFGPGNVNDLHGFRRADFFAWIICFSTGSSVIFSLEPEAKSQISDIFVLSLLHFPGTPRQLNHSGTLTIKLIGLNVIFCPLKMDEMLGRSVKGRNCVNNRSTPSRTCDLDQT